MWFVEIYKYEDDELIDSIECSSERQAEKVEDGVNINLNHEEYYTLIKKYEE